MDGFPTMGVPNTGDTAWMLASAALVLLMTPGLAFFYGGMVRAKNVLNMIMMSISAMGLVTVLWVLYGYSMAFGNDVSNLFGDPAQYFGLKGLIGANGADAVAAARPTVWTPPPRSISLSWERCQLRCSSPSSSCSRSSPSPSSRVRSPIG
ncbi:ammonium transporter [Mycobacteroides abscessus]|nr:ammonium transporter [Mycobacteroides abscessus]